MGIHGNLYFRECHWISFNKLLCAIYETTNIQKMTVINIENYKQKQNSKHKKLCNYNECRLSLSFAAMLRNAHFRVIIPLLIELNINLNDNVMNEKHFKNDTNEEKKSENLSEIVMDREEMFVIQCKKCRKKLFNDLLITAHSMNAIGMQCAMKPNVCNCIFLDIENEKTLKLLNSLGNISEMEGLLSCYKCKSKMGRFNYYGQKCSCNEWICPSFQVSVSKVDISRKRQKYLKTNQAKYFGTKVNDELNEDAPIPFTENSKMTDSVKNHLISDDIFKKLE